MAGKNQFSGSPTSYPEFSYTNLDKRAVKYLNNKQDLYSNFELRDLEEEEKYIQLIQMQREKLEKFQQHFQQKNFKIKELENEISEYRKYKQESAKFRQLLERCEKQLAEKERQLEETQNSVNISVSEYEISVQEMQTLILQEREKRLGETKVLRDKLVQKEQEYENLRFDYEELQDQLDQQTNTNNEKEKELNFREKSISDKEKQQKQLERMLKDQVSELAHEKTILETKNKDFSMQLESQHEELRRLQGIEEKLQQERQYTMDLKEVLQQKNKEIQELKLELEGQHSNIQLEYNNINDEFDRALNLISRQEQTISDMRNMRMEDQQLIQGLEKELLKFKNEHSFYGYKHEKIQQENEELWTRLNTIEADFESLKLENKKLVEELEQFQLKEQQQNNERKEWISRRMKLMSHRNAEATKLNSALDSFVQEKSQSRSFT